MMMMTMMIFFLEWRWEIFKRYPFGMIYQTVVSNNDNDILKSSLRNLVLIQFWKYSFLVNNIVKNSEIFPFRLCFLRNIEQKVTFKELEN